ncbi:single-stranded DNA-binding protein [Pedobacter hiemivivus]|uniref:Single-stranded DNA-binding protein n=1 Tax=Pedobacter hiemivivus TaxID=2530454 RepID=A0A4R0NEF0_9SPHI|nr:single-stranded DNA-binding protein [Pedobacter hiemivivus]TCC98810.1 single-stranded DNA-binding protein [Pedobacter hiemivivus]
MEITGRLTADAVVRTTKTDKKVVGFNLAHNETYKSKGEKKQVTTFFECSYWLNEGIAMYLKKGVIVELAGMAGVRAYVVEGEPRASLTFRVDKITLYSNGAAVPQQVLPAEVTAPVSSGAGLQPLEQFDTVPIPEGDLPF